MIVYLFRLNPAEADPKEINELLEFISTLSTLQFNYLPSKKIAVLASNESVITPLSNWIVENVNFKFEFEEHQDGSRKLVQWDPAIGKSFTTQFLLPLFTPESYLEL